MAWSDIFYPGNPGRRRRVTEMMTKILTLMEVNFNRTNALVDTIHKYLPGQRFGHITVDHENTIAENADTLIVRMTEIISYIEAKKVQCRDQLDPDLFRQLMDKDRPFAEVIALVKKIEKTAVVCMGVVTTVAVCSLLSRGMFLTTMVQAFSTLKVCSVAFVAIGAVFVGIDMIISAITGASERSKLEKALTSLGATLKTFEPASHEYSKQVEKIIVTIELFYE